MRPKDALLYSAYKKLEISAEDVEQSAKIEPLLRAVGGRLRIMEYLTASEEPEARQIVKLYWKLEAHARLVVPLEAYALAVHISPKKLFGIISQEVMDQSTRVSAMLAKAAHPSVVQATIAVAKKTAGVRDREMIHKAVGFLPTPKNSFTVVQGNQHIDQSRKSVNVAVLPPVESLAKNLTTRFIDVVPAAAPQLAAGDEDEED